MADRPTALVTGANRGIGLELARHFAGEGCDVIGVCRETSPELKEVATRVIESVDVTTASGLQSLIDGVKGQSIDLLINNAGLLQDEKLGSIDFDSIRTQMEINAYAPLRVAEALVSQIPYGGKIANITSRMGSIADNDSGGRYGYRASKAALNQIGHGAAIELARHDRDAILVALHPGTVETAFTAAYAGRHRMVPAQEAAQNLLQVIEGLDPSQSGGFYDWRGEEVPW